MKLKLNKVWCPDCMTFHDIDILEQIPSHENVYELRCPCSVLMNSTLLIAELIEELVEG